MLYIKRPEVSLNGREADIQKLLDDMGETENTQAAHGSDKVDR